MNGYTGRILRLDLTREKVSFIDTGRYEEWVGGHGIGSAIFWDLVEDKTIDGFDPRNVVTIMTSPLTGTLAPGGASRIEMQGIGVQSYPIGWFTRSNMGGRFGAMLKYAGWDGIVIEGRAGRPVWIDIRNQEVRFRNAEGYWGLDTWETQKSIWSQVSGTDDTDNWTTLGDEQAGGRTTQRPAVMAIGPAGERQARIAAIVHDAGNAAGQGGFGAVFGSKKLKAISVIGTQGIAISQPGALLEARSWAKENYSLDIRDPDSLNVDYSLANKVDARSTSTFATHAVPIVFWQRPKESRPQACVGCPAGCRARNDTGLGNESMCAETIFYSYPDMKRHSQTWAKGLFSVFEYFFGYEAAMFLGLVVGKNTSAAYTATDLSQKLGINAFELMMGLPYLRNLNKMGLLGPGKQIDCDLPFDKFGELEFAEKLLNMMAFQEGLGRDLSEGFFRAAKKWGRLEEDLKTGLLPYHCWGLPGHFDPRIMIEWGYGTALGDRDVNEHDFTNLFLLPTVSKAFLKEPMVSAEELARIYTDKMLPFQGDPLMVDYSDENIYSEHMVKLVAWHRYYTRFWKQSVLYCDFLFPEFINPARKDRRGMVTEGEPKFLDAVTGNNMSFVQGIELGRRIWNLDNAIWVLQGRHRDQVRFADYIYDQPLEPVSFLPAVKDGQWEYMDVSDRSLDRQKFEDWKTRFYEFEGWDPASGWPTRKTLNSLGLTQVADELEKNNRLGKDKNEGASKTI